MTTMATAAAIEVLNRDIIDDETDCITPPRPGHA